jgi:arylsulfatase A-like enzyme
MHLLAGVARALIALICLGLGGFVACSEGAPRATRPLGNLDDLGLVAQRAGPAGDMSVLFIVIDTLRADRLGCYGYARDTSPVIDAVARHGIRFEDVLAHASWTKTSMASLWTGTWPVTHGVLSWSHALPEAARMPAEAFRERGYRTAGLFRNGWVDSIFGFAQGFQNYYQPRANATPEKLARKNPSSRPLQGSDVDVTEAAREFLRSFREERFFLYLHYMDVHQYAYDESSALFGTSYSDAYDNAIRWVDRNVAAVLSALDETGRSPHTLVVIASDHGEEFGEHGGEGHGRTLYREVTRVPWIIALPFTLERGVVVATPVQNVDVWPTLYDLLGFPLPDGLDGSSALPLIRAAGDGSERPHEARAAFAHLNRNWGRPDRPQRPTASLRLAGGRLIRHASGAEELYDLAQDPNEQRDRSAQDPEQVAELSSLLDAYLAREARPWGAPDERALDEVDLGHLRALGYVIK